MVVNIKHALLEPVDVVVNINMNSWNLLML